jgi:hypothetical protein
MITLSHWSILTLFWIRIWVRILLLYYRSMSNDKVLFNITLSLLVDLVLSLFLTYLFFTGSSLILFCNNYLVTGIRCTYLLQYHGGLPLIGQSSCVGDEGGVSLVNWDGEVGAAYGVSSVSSSVLLSDISAIMSLNPYGIKCGFGWMGGRGTPWSWVCWTYSWISSIILSSRISSRYTMPRKYVNIAW